MKDEHNEMLETIIAMDEDQLAKEIGFAEGFVRHPTRRDKKWLGMLREELEYRQQRRAEYERTGR